MKLCVTVTLFCNYGFTRPVLYLANYPHNILMTVDNRVREKALHYLFLINLFFRLDTRNNQQGNNIPGLQREASIAIILKHLLNS